MNLSELGAALRAAHDKIGEAQSSAGVTRDRGDEALRQLATAGDESANVLLANAIERVAAADAALDEVLGMYVAANEQIELYLRAKQL